MYPNGKETGLYSTQTERQESHPTDLLPFTVWLLCVLCVYRPRAGVCAPFEVLCAGAL